MVPSTSIRPVVSVFSAVACAIGWTAKPVVHTVTAAGMVESAVVTRSASTAVTAVCSCTVMPSRSTTFRRCRAPLGESQSPSPPRAARATSRSGRASAISVAASRPVSPPPTTTTGCPAARPARRSRSRSAPGRPAMSWACSAVPGTPCVFQALPRAYTRVSYGSSSVDCPSVTVTVLRSTSTAVTLASRSRTPVPANISLKRRGRSSWPTASWCILTRSTKSGSALTRVMATSWRRSLLARRPAAIAPEYPAPMTMMRCCVTCVTCMS
ncbi:hypothetical protein SMICM304S_11467 [Streptomyces microflavus]